MNFSFIRPRGSFIYGIGVETPGAVKYMELFDKASDIITAGSGTKSKNNKAKGKIRKGAMMGVLWCWHPDIEEFIDAKLTEGRLSKFNISVGVSDEFMDKVISLKEAKAKGETEFIKNNDNWELVFPDTKYPNYKEEWDGDIEYWKSKGYPIKVYKTISVLGLWEQIMKSTYTRNDPGILFLDRANKTHCWNYAGQKSKIHASNPCGEQMLPFASVCNLSSINLTQLLNEDYTNFDYEKVKKYVSYAVRFLDNVNDYTNAPLEQYSESIRNRRRIGIGVMGWGSALYMMKVPFASERAEKIKSDMMKIFTEIAIKTSVELAKEKGMFKDCDPEKHANSYFFKQIGLSDELISEIKANGIRNSALFSIQPTGNTSILANICSGGLEPIFMAEYIRTVIVPICPDDLKPLVPKYWEGEFKETKLFKLTKEGSDDVLKAEYNGIIYKIDRNRGLTKEVPCIDYGVRFLKERGEWNQSAEWAKTALSLKVEEHVTDMAGWGKWIDSSMSKTVNCPSDYPYESFENLYLNAYKTGYLKGITTYRAGTMTNVLSQKEESPKEETISIKKTTAPKRPKELVCKVEHLTSKGVKYYGIVGLMEGEPYEVFTGTNENKDGVTFIPKSVVSGKIVKNSRGNYSLVNGDDRYDLTNGHSDSNADALTRMISTSLRHGADISFIVHQLEKTEGDMTCFARSLSRVLKKCIKDGTIVHGETCSNCGSQNLTRSEGCIVCTDCGTSKCG
jgi:ribonucleoside-diphosphate reductase alpha chain